MSVRSDVDAEQEPAGALAAPSRLSNKSYSEISVVMARVQGALLAMGSLVALYMGSVDETLRNGCNMSNSAIASYVVMAITALCFLAIEVQLWSTRVATARMAMSKHKDDVAVPHGADPVPDADVPWGSTFRMVRLLSFATTGALAGGHSPHLGIVLAGSTPSGHTLHAAWLLWAFAAGSLVAAVLRHLSPFLSSAVTVYRDEAPDARNRLLQLVTVTLTAGLDAAAFGAAVSAAHRPLSSVSVSSIATRAPGRALLLSFVRTSPPPPIGPAPPPAPPIAPPLAPPFAPPPPYFAAAQARAPSVSICERNGRGVFDPPCNPPTPAEGYAHGQSPYMTET